MKKTASILLLLLAGCTVAQAEPRITPEPDPFAGITIPDEVQCEESDCEESIGLPTQEAPKIHVYGPKWCSVCREIPDSPRYRKHSEPFPDWVYERADKYGFPVIHYQKDGQWYSRHGWKGEEELDRHIAPQKSKCQNETLIRYPVRGGWWTHPGTIWNHLVSHGYSEEYVRSLSYAEAMSLHSDHHEGRVKGNPPRRSAVRSAPVRAGLRRSYCPTCPR